MFEKSKNPIKGQTETRTATKRCSKDTTETLMVHTKMDNFTKKDTNIFPGLSSSIQIAFQKSYRVVGCLGMDPVTCSTNSGQHMVGK